MKPLKIYIAGKITGMDYETAFDAFADAESYLAAIGHEPLNPMKLVDQEDGRAYNEYLLDALGIAIYADAIYMLTNWRDSKGARIEHAIAEIMGKQIYYEAANLEVVPESN